MWKLSRARPGSWILTGSRKAKMSHKKNCFEELYIRSLGRAEAWSHSKQCCGSGMFIPDAIFPSRIQVRKDSGSRIRILIKEFKYFYPKKLFSKLLEI
jgi:hypothetical protein